jgi:hypothetical protein
MQKLASIYNDHKAEQAAKSIELHSRLKKQGEKCCSEHQSSKAIQLCTQHLHI